MFAAEKGKARQFPLGMDLSAEIQDRPEPLSIMRTDPGLPLYDHRKLPPLENRSLRLLARRAHAPATHDQPANPRRHARGVAESTTQINCTSRS